MYQIVSWQTTHNIANKHFHTVSTKFSSTSQTLPLSLFCITCLLTLNHKDSTRETTQSTQTVQNNFNPIINITNQ